MDREAIVRSVNNGQLRHIVYDDPSGTRFVDGYVVFCGETTTVIERLDGDEISVLNNLIERIEPYAPTRRTFR